MSIHLIGHLLVFGSSYTFVVIGAISGPNVAWGILSTVGGIVGFGAAVIFASYAILALEFSRQIFGQQRESLYCVRPDGLRTSFLAALSALLILWFTSLMILVAVNMFLVALANPSTAELLNMLYATVLFFGGITLVGLLFGMLVGRVANRATGYASILTAFLLFSPILDDMLWTRMFGMSYGEQLFVHWALVAPFSLLNALARLAIDALYLIPVETQQWLLYAIWIIALLTGLFVSLSKRKSLAIPVAGLVFTLLIVPWASYGARVALPRIFETSPQAYGERSLMPDIWEGFDNNESLDITPYLEPVPTVVQYQLDMTIGDMLSGRVTVVLEEAFGAVPKFTLFRGYKLHSVTDLEGNPLEFIQDFDTVTITTVGQEQSKGFIFEYSGSGWGYFANHQAVFLAGTFPWYPWPGEQRFYWEWDNPDGQTRSFDRRGEVQDIQLRVKSSHAEIFTPHNIVIGQSEEFVHIPAQSVTMFTGAVARAGDLDSFVVYGGKGQLEAQAWWSQKSDWEYDLFDKQARLEILSETYRLREMMGFDYPKDLNSRTMVVVPFPARFNNLYDSPRYMEGYILIPEGIVLNYSVVLALQGMPALGEKGGLFEILSKYLSDPEDFLMWYPGMAEAEVFELDSGEQVIFASTRHAFSDTVNARGEAYTVRRVVEYLMDESMTMSPVDFLEAVKRGQ